MNIWKQKRGFLVYARICTAYGNQSLHVKTPLETQQIIKVHENQKCCLQKTLAAGDWNKLL